MSGYPLDVMGPGEVAEHCGVEKPTVSKWQARGYMPPADAELMMGNVWRGPVIRRWNKKRVAAIRERFNV